LLATVSGVDRRVFLPGQSDIDNNRSRYQFIEKNFYGDQQFRAVYGVSGAGPAFYFDGERCIKIRTPLPANKDMPRHIAKHGDTLALGFWDGAVVCSGVGDPFEMRGLLGAFSVEVGDRLLGLMPLASDALGVICETSTYALRGATIETSFQSAVSESRGGIEYTAADMGRVILADSFGLFAADAAESFGPAERNYLSTQVIPWLERRLQCRCRFSSLRPIMAARVRGKNQYRLYFWDGWVLTMTMKASGPEFTTQRYFQPGEDGDPDRPWPIRSVCSMLDATGRERMFASFYGGVKGGMVYELDTGRTFDGSEIPRYLTVNPLSAGASAQLERFDRFWVYGTATGLAELQASRGVNYEIPAGDVFQPFTLGGSDRLARTEQTPQRGVVDFPIEGFDMVLRIDGDAPGRGEYCLQMLEMIVDRRGISRGTKG
jgi:hypothetical protein